MARVFHLTMVAITSNEDLTEDQALEMFDKWLDGTIKAGKENELILWKDFCLVQIIADEKPRE